MEGAEEASKRNYVVATDIMGSVSEEEVWSEGERTPPVGRAEARKRACLAERGSQPFAVEAETQGIEGTEPSPRHLCGDKDALGPVPTLCMDYLT